MMVRSAAPDDIAAMMRLGRHSATAAQWAPAQYEGVFRADWPRRLALVIEELQVLQGFLIAQEVAGEWEIENIAVAGTARRRGLGTRLLGEFIKQVKAEGAAAVYLEVRESNHAARGLYEKWALVECGRRPRYYHEPVEDAIVYRLTFV